MNHEPQYNNNKIETYIFYSLHISFFIYFFNHNKRPMSWFPRGHVKVKLRDLRVLEAWLLVRNVNLVLHATLAACAILHKLIETYIVLMECFS